MRVSCWMATGIAERSQSMGKRKGRPIAGTLRMMSVSSIAEAFQAYVPQWTTSEEILTLPERCSEAMERHLLMNRKRRSTRTDLWLPLRAGLQAMLRLEHIASKYFLNGEPASGATRRQNPTRRRTCFMKAAARVAESSVSTSTTMANVVRLHMAARTYGEPAYGTTLPGCHIST